MCATSGNVKLIELLIENGAKISEKNKLEYTPLHISIQNGHFDMTKFLLDNKANPHQKGLVSILL